jgi:hypothetical protein
MTSCSLLYSSAGRVECISQNPERRADSIFRDVDPKNGSIERSVGVDVSPKVLNALRNLIGRPRFGTLEEHVLENMGQSRAEVLVFIDASRGAPCLHTRYGRAVVLLHDDSQTVGQNPFLRRARRKTDYLRWFGGRSLQINHGKEYNGCDRFR